MQEKSLRRKKRKKAGLEGIFRSIPFRSAFLSFDVLPYLIMPYRTAALFCHQTAEFTHISIAVHCQKACCNCHRVVCEIIFQSLFQRTVMASSVYRNIIFHCHFIHINLSFYHIMTDPMSPGHSALPHHSPVGFSLYRYYHNAVSAEETDSLLTGFEAILTF